MSHFSLADMFAVEALSSWADQVSSWQTICSILKLHFAQLHEQGCSVCAC